MVGKTNAVVGESVDFTEMDELLDRLEIAVGEYQLEPEEEYFLTFSSSEPFTLMAFPGWDGELEYSTDKETWNTWSDEEISSGSNNELYLRGIGNTSIGTNFEFSGDDNISCTGNIENLLDYETVELGNHPVMANDCFSGLFMECTLLTVAPELPATTLAQSCYAHMFYGCTSLINAPSLPATTLADYCYNAMFLGCISLETAPALPATTLEYICYNNMFYGCTSLTMLPALPATALAQYCYNNMFRNCTLIKISETQTGEYQNAYRIPTSGTGVVENDWNANMFTSTGGTFTSAPTINTTYYTSNAIINPDGTITPAVQGV